MTESATDAPEDAELVAFLDGELAEPERLRLAERLDREPELCRRLAQLAQGGRPFRRAGQLLLEAAPLERLQRHLVAVPRPADPETRRPRFWQQGRRVLPWAAAVLLFCLGLAAGRWLPPQEAEQGNWRQVVAEYLTLYTKDTFAPEDAAVRARELSLLGDKLGVDVSAPRIALANLELKGAQVLDFHGVPLGQISYLDPSGEPVSLCIIRNGESTAPMRIEHREGFTLVHWAAAGRAYLLIGHLPAGQLEALATSVSERLSL